MTEGARPPSRDVVTLERLPGHVALVRLNRPGARNAVDGAVARALDAAVAETEGDPEIRVTVLAGSAGGVFCAGADLKEIAAGRAAELWTPRGGFAGFVFAERAKPWIAAVGGKALAGGCELVLACELVVAAEDAAFGLPEVSRGLIAAAGGLFRLPRALPRALALELILTADTLDARRAYEHGLVNHLVPAGRVARNAPLAVRESLAVARRAHELTEVELRALTGAARERVVASEDFREGPRAFVEKRAPRWSGR